MATFVDSRRLSVSRRVPPGGKVSLVFGDEIPLQPIQPRVSNRVPPGGKVNIVFADEFTSKNIEPPAQSPLKNRDFSDNNHSFDQTLHRSKTFQSTLFTTEGLSPDSTPIRAAKRVLPVKKTAIGEVDSSEIEQTVSSPRPAKKQSAILDRSSMNSILKPKNGTVAEEKTESKASVDIQAPPAGCYRVPTGYQGQSPQAIANLFDAKKPVSTYSDRTSMNLVLSAVKPPPPSKYGVSPGGPATIHLG